jgi:hypothetical protein
MQVLLNTIAQRVERLEISHVLCELVVHDRQNALPDVLDLHCVVYAGAGHLLDCVIVGVMNGEVLLPA